MNTSRFLCLNRARLYVELVGVIDQSTDQRNYSVGQCRVGTRRSYRLVT
jgi:hypothetical protein